MHIIPNLVLKSLIAGFLAVLLVSASIVYFARLNTSQTIASNVFVNTLDLSGMTESQATETLALAIKKYRSQWPVTFTYQAYTLPVALKDTEVQYDIQQAVTKAMEAKAGFKYLPFLVSKSPHYIELPAIVDQSWLASQSATIVQSLDQPAINAHLEVVSTASGAAIQIIDGKDGRQFDQTQWEQSITSALKTLTLPDTELPIKPTYQATTQDQKTHAYQVAQSLLKRTLNLSLQIESQPERTWKLSGEDLVRFVDVQTQYNTPIVKSYVDGLAQNINQPPKDAKFQFNESTSKVEDFVPAEKGIVVDVDNTTQALISMLDQVIVDSDKNTVHIAIHTTEPDVQISEVNRLGIKELIGIGRSTFQHSIPSRVHNVILGSSRINGTLVKPGEEFSFNQAVGDISAATGYQQAYIIQNGRTVLGDGGGMCQVSTTVFRAALNAGLTITSRKSHAYRVGYYEQDTKAGIDATVFSPSTDFKFLNDTPAHILVQTKVNEPNRELTIYFYGTSDGRTTEITDHQVWGITPPLPDVWIDDPTIPNGTVKQVDWKAAGAKAKFTQIVRRDGQILFEKTFYSNYQPWASVFLRGTKL